jgi:nicotinate phosphoribosyltransferase
LVETRIINLLQFQILIATKANRMKMFAPGKFLIDFGFRRAHGTEAGLLTARASYLCGFAGTATVAAGAIWDIPLYGTMAHSFIEAHENEMAAFENFAHSHPRNVIFLIDTYDTNRAAHRVVELHQKLKKQAITIIGVRIDSGDLAYHAHSVRFILDAAGLQEIKIFATGGLDEMDLKYLCENQAPIDGFGIGTSLATSDDVPNLNCAYKLQEYDGRICRKLSEGKETLPGIKQVFRQFDADGTLLKDSIALVGEKSVKGKPLLQACMRSGRRIQPPTQLEIIRNFTAEQRNHLQKRFMDHEAPVCYPVNVSNGIQDLIKKFDDWKKKF